MCFTTPSPIVEMSEKRGVLSPIWESVLKKHKSSSISTVTAVEIKSSGYVSSIDTINEHSGSPFNWIPPVRTAE